MRTADLDASEIKLAEVQNFIMEMRRELHSGGLGFPYGAKGMLDWVTAFSDSRNDRVSKVYQHILDLTEDHKVEYRPLGGGLRLTTRRQRRFTWKDIGKMFIRECSRFMSLQKSSQSNSARFLQRRMF